MKRHLIAVFFALMVLPSLVVGTGLPQTRSANEPPKSVLIAGCLVKGDAPGEVWLAQKDGRIYGLEERKEEAAEDAQKENNAGKRETADFRVRMLKMISKSCRHSD